MNRQTLLQKLPPVTGQEMIIKDDQEVDDIIREVLDAHQAFGQDYDYIALEFVGPAGIHGSSGVEKRLYDYCRRNLKYDVESEDLQTTRSPGVLLSMGRCDCKGYAGFIAGVLDALNRKTGKKMFDWKYRFGVYDDTEETPGHVFVVVKKGDGSEIWVDPVLDGFNKREPKPIQYEDHRPNPGKIGLDISALLSSDPAVRSKALADAGIQPGNADPGIGLSQALHAYELGLADNVGQLINQNKLSPGIQDILKQAVASSVPGALQVMGIANSLTQGISNALGPGSVVTRMAQALASSNVLTAIPNVLNAALGGRTFNSSNYLGAWDYYFHVAGVNKGDSTGVADSEVPEALKWFITKLGIYIDSRQHLAALRAGVDQYMGMVNVSPFTTQDRVRVTLARDVLLKYMPDSQNLGDWKNAIGVYDNQVIAAIFKSRIMDPTAQTDTSGSVPITVNVSNTVKDFIKANPLISIGVVALAVWGIYELVKD